MASVECPKPDTSKSVSNYKLVGCGDCDTGYTSIQDRKLIGCAEECKKVNCKRFSYGEKNAVGTAGLGCRVSKGESKCPNTVKRYCGDGYTPHWAGASKQCCESTKCGKINYWGGNLYEPEGPLATCPSHPVYLPACVEVKP